MNEHLRTDEELRALVESFEACAMHPEDFRHWQHLAVAFSYVSTLPYDEAVVKMSSGIRRLAERYSKTGYHETITLFWLRVVRSFAQSHNLKAADAANRLIEQCDDKHLIRQYYSSEILDSEKAKHEWVEPDLKPLP